MTNKRSWLIRHCAPVLIVSFLSTPFAYSKSLQSLELEHGCGQLPAVDAASSDNRDLRMANASSFAGSASVSTNENKALSARDYLADVAPDGLYRWPSNKLPVKVFFQASDKVPYFAHRFPSSSRVVSMNGPRRPMESLAGLRQ